MTSEEQQRVFCEWVRTHSAIIHRAVNGFASGSDRDDLLQEILLAVWKAVPAFRGRSKDTTYLYRVCHNAALVWVRGERNFKRRNDAFATYHDVGVEDRCSNQDTRLSRLYSAIRDLRPVDRSLILLSLDGLSYREMSDVMGISESNVGAKLSRIRTRLAETMKGGNNEY